MFREEKLRWPLEMCNTSDSMPIDMLKESDKREFRSFFVVSEQEEIVYCRDTSFFNTRTQGLVVTDWGIHAILDSSDPDDYIKFAWEQIEKVEYSDGVFLFWGYGEKSDDNCIPIHTNFFSKDDPSLQSCQQLAAVFNRICSVLAEQEHPIDAALAKMTQESIDPHEVDKIGRNILGKYPQFDFMVLYQLGVNAFFNLKDLEMAYRYLSKSLSCDENNDSVRRTWAHYLISSIFASQGQWNAPELRYHCFMTSKGDPECKNNSKTLVEESMADLYDLELSLAENGYKDVPYENRKIILPVDNLCALSDLSQEQVRPVLLEALRNSKILHFPVGHPVAKTLYVCHPYNQTNYIPFENYEIDLLEDKLREFSLLVQALGATEISVKVESSQSEDERRHRGQTMNGNVDSIFSGRVSTHADISSEASSKWEHTFNRRQILKPSNTISVPEGLIWLEGEPDWKRLIQQRLNGSLQYHHESWSTKKTKVVSGQAATSLRGELQTIYADLGMDWSDTEELFASSESNLALSIDVTFGTPESTYPATKIQSFSECELEYIKEYQECLANGEISNSERRLLNRLGARLGLSDVRIVELEQSIAPKLSAEEEEYLAEYRECLKDEPIISASTRRLLNRLAVSLNLSEEQVSRIEKM